MSNPLDPVKSTVSILIIHTAARLVMQTFEEKVAIGGAAATFSVGGSVWTISAWTISSELTQFNVDTVAIAKAVEEVVGTLSFEFRLGPPLHHLPIL